MWALLKNSLRTMLDLTFSEAEMGEFLRVRGYTIAVWPVHRMVQHGPLEEEEKVNVTVAFKKSQRDELTSCYWLTETEKHFGIKNVFTRELKHALLRL